MQFLADRSRIISIGLAGVGAVVAFYLSWVKLTHQEVFCGASGDCATVSNSPYAEIGGIPIAILGLGAYVVILGLLIFEPRFALLRQYNTMIVFGLTLTGTIYSAYLTYLEFAVIHAICPYCVISAIVMTLLFIVAIFRVAQAPTETRAGWSDSAW